MTRDRTEWLISVVDNIGKWHKATASGLVRDAGASPQMAAKWAKARREMSSAGLKKKLRERVN